LAFLCLFKEINALKRKLKLKLKRLQAARRTPRKAESILSTQINLTTSIDEGEQQEYFLLVFKQFTPSKTKLAKSSHPTTELVVSNMSCCQP
jgi:hypothetical protein